MTFAVLKTGGKQYIVREGDQLLIEKILPAVGESVNFDEVLMLWRPSADVERRVEPDSSLVSPPSSSAELPAPEVAPIFGRQGQVPDGTQYRQSNFGTGTIGQPLIAGAKVEAKVVEQGRAAKKIVFKYKSKTRQHKKKGHRQPFTKVEIIKIIG